MVDSRQKGSRTENQAKDILKRHTRLNWQRVPGSGALAVAHQLKGDLYIPNASNKYCVEVKGYKEDHLTSKILTDKNPQLAEWWSQAVRQGKQVDMTPLLIFKKDRGKFFVAVQELEDFEVYRSIYIPHLDIWVCLLEDWLKHEKPEFI